MNRVGVVFKQFGSGLALLQYGKPIVPLALYFVVKLAIIVVYASTGAGPLASAWRILRPGPGGEALAHYPDRLLFMPIVLGRLDLALDILVLAFMQGASVMLVAAGSRRERMDLRGSFRASGTRYLHLAISAAIASAAMLAVFRGSAVLFDRVSGASRGVEAVASVVLGLVVQALFAYAVAAIVLEGRSALGGVRESVLLATRRPVESLTLVVVPFLLTVPTLLLSLNPQAVAFQISPEFLVQVQIAGELVELVTGYLLLGGITLFFLETRRKGDAQ